MKYACITYNEKVYLITFNVQKKSCSYYKNRYDSNQNIIVPISPMSQPHLRPQQWIQLIFILFDFFHKTHRNANVSFYLLDISCVMRKPAF